MMAVRPIDAIARVVPRPIHLKGDRDRTPLRGGSGTTAVTICVLLGWPTHAFGASLQAVPSGSTVRISLDQAGSQAFRPSYPSYISPDGRFIVVGSEAAMQLNDLNGTYDTYIYDSSIGGPLELISVNGAGMAGNMRSIPGDISDDGRFVSFYSEANDLVSGDTNGSPDAFVRDRLLGTTYLCSVSSAGIQGQNWAYVRLSGNGRYVVFSSSAALVSGDSNGAPDVFVRDLQALTTECVSVNMAGLPANAGSGGLDMTGISSDGRYVCFASAASNLVAGDSNGQTDVFVRDRLLGQMARVSTSTSGQQGDAGSGWPEISSSGQIVVFQSLASDLVAGDTNATWDIFVRDIALGITERVSVASAGVEANDQSIEPTVSPDGRFIGFVSRATNLEPNDTNGTWDSFVHDRLTKRTSRVSTNASAVQGDAASYNPYLARNARTIAFGSDATNLVQGDTNSVADVFARRWPAPTTYCTAGTNSLGCVSSIDYSGVPMASHPQGFVISASHILNRKTGILIYSTHGSATNSFHGGTLCIQGPLRRTQRQLSGGSLTGSDCTGSYAYEFNALIAVGSDSALIAGQQVWAQYWSRDPGFAPPQNANLTDALTFVIDP